jgi:inorganic triphosphatase YgiF
MLEIELKFRIAPRLAGQLWNCTALRALSIAAPGVQRFNAVYYDTPDSKFRRSGTAVRVRRESRKWIMAVKWGATAAGGLHRREELETEVAGPALDRAVLERAGLGEAHSDHRAIQSIFATRFRRQRVLIEPEPGTRIELALDRGWIVAGEQRARLSEVELELKAGEQRALFAIARQLLDEVPLRLEPATKSARGYRLAAGLAGEPVKAEPIELDAGQSVDDAFATVALGCLHHLLENDRGMLDSPDPEYVHQARVGLRRLRACFALFARAVPKQAFEPQLAALKELALRLGEARDWDVYLGETLPRAQGGSRSPDLRAVKKRALRAASRARSVVRTTLAAPAYGELMLDLTERFAGRHWREGRSAEYAGHASTPLKRYAGEALRARRDRLRHLASAIGSSDIAALHRLRVAGKKLRYGCQFFAPLFPGGNTQTYLRRLADLQDVLGNINDMATGIRLSETLSDKARGPQRAGLAYVSGFSDASMRSAVQHLEPAWKRLQRAEPFW